MLVTSKSKTWLPLILLTAVHLTLFSNTTGWKRKNYYLDILRQSEKNKILHMLVSV